MKLTIEELEAMHPCSDAMEWARKQKSLHAAWEKCKRADWMIWFLRRKSLLAKPIAVEFAIACAERVIGIYEKKYPAGKRPRQAIEAAKSWLADPSEENRKVAYAAAYAAADAAADAAYAAAYAAADAAADADRAKERKWQANKLRSLVPNPFDK